MLQSEKPNIGGDALKLKEDYDVVLNGLVDLARLCSTLQPDVFVVGRRSLKAMSMEARWDRLK
jgi:hypothetical protein